MIFLRAKRKLSRGWRIAAAAFFDSLAPDYFETKQICLAGSMNINLMTFLLACLVTASVATPAHALQPVRHNLIRGDMPPGMAAQFYQVGDPALRGHVQPVQLVAPTNTNIEIGDAASNFGQARTSQMSVGMAVGYVYRFKLSNLPVLNAVGESLYPSIEVFGKLSPPAGLEKDFPIQVVVTEDDIELALTGRMVTRVIYLEDPRGDLPHLHTTTDQPSIDVVRGQDPLRAAEQMGRPMAILRMGSRVPMEGEIAEWFTFGIAAPTVLPDPRPVNRLGFSERELSFLQAARDAEAKAAEMAKADSIAVDVASSDQQASVKSVAASIELDAANKVRRPDISLVDADQTGRQPEAGIFAGTTTNSQAKQPKWVRVRADAKQKSKSNRSNSSVLLSSREISTANNQSKAPSPAPSMAGLFAEPIDTADTNDLPTIRRPNEL